MNYEYYVVYGTTTNQGLGSAIVTLSKEVISEKAIDTIEELIAKETGYDKEEIVIVNWTLLKKPEKDFTHLKREN